MIKTIFIDESGSLNDKKISYFSITLVIIDEDKYNKTKNNFKRCIRKIRSKEQIDKNIEIKAHYLKTIGKLEYLENVLDLIINKLENKFICVYLDNKKLNPKLLNDKGSTYNFLVKCAIERMIDIGLLSNDDELLLISDTYCMQKKYMNTLQQYLISEFILNREIFSSIFHTYEDSRKNWGIQLADYLAFKNNRIICNQKFLINKKYFRYVY